MNLRPTGNRIVVERTETEHTTPGGIVLADVSKQPTSTGVILAVGPGSRDGNGVMRKIDLGTGDKILFRPGSGVEHKLPNKTVVIMNEGDVLAVFGEDK